MILLKDTVFRWFMVSATSFGILVSCDKGHAAETRSPAAAPTMGEPVANNTEDHAEETKVIEPGDQSSDSASMSLVFFYPPGSGGRAESAWNRCSAVFPPGIKKVRKFSEGLKPPFIVFDPSVESDSLPDIENLLIFGRVRGMSRRDIDAVMGSERAAVVRIVMPRNETWGWSLGLNIFAHLFARSTGAFIYDRATHECFHPHAWMMKRDVLWGRGFAPDIRSQINLHFYPAKDGTNTAITSGMEKFGLPDVAIEGLSSGQDVSAEHLIYLVCQSLIVKPVVSNPEMYKISIAKLEPAALRNSYQCSLNASGTGNAIVSLAYRKSQKKDSGNRLLFLKFTHGTGGTEKERMASTLSQFLGMGSTVRMIRTDDPENLKDLSRKADRVLYGHQGAFQAGLPLGFHLVVRVAFTSNDGSTEFRWIEVTKWNDDGLVKGLHRNHPKEIKRYLEPPGVAYESKERAIIDCAFTGINGRIVGEIEKIR